MGMQTPMSKIVRRGTIISTVDTTGREEVVSMSPTVDKARWMLAGLRSFHKDTPVEEAD